MQFYCISVVITSGETTNICQARWLSLCRTHCTALHKIFQSHVDAAGREPNAETWPVPFFLCESPGSNNKALFSFMPFMPWVFLKPHLTNLSLNISHFSVKSRIVQTGQDSLQLSHSSQSTQELAQNQALHHLQPSRNTFLPPIALYPRDFPPVCAISFPSERGTFHHLFHQVADFHTYKYCNKQNATETINHAGTLWQIQQCCKLMYFQY